LCRQLNVTEATFYRWKKQFGEIGVAELRGLRVLREENKKLKQVVADLTLDKQILREALGNKFCGRPARARWLRGWSRATGAANAAPAVRL
jgi:putative transposase